MNILRLSAMQHLFAFAAAIFITASLLVGAAANAQGRNAGFYSATLTAPAAAPRAVAGSLVWNCAGTACTAGRDTSRPAVVCARLVRQLGPVSSFVANGRALEADDLARCNAAV